MPAISTRPPPNSSSSGRKPTLARSPTSSGNKGLCWCRIYVTDTHPLLYYATNTKRKMSPKAWKAFEAAWAGEALIHIPAVALWETCNLVKSGSVILSEAFRRWVDRIMNHRGFNVVPFDQDCVCEVNDSPFKDPYDAAIAGAARLLELPLITRDARITDSGWVDIYW